MSDELRPFDDLPSECPACGAEPEAHPKPELSFSSIWAPCYVGGGTMMWTCMRCGYATHTKTKTPLP